MTVLTGCPACDRRWPIDAAELGREAPCPACGAVAPTRDIGLPPGVRPHRANLVFGLGVASLAIIGLFGPFAWWMARRDLKRMERGEMDPAGYKNTRVALRMGQIGTAKCVIEVLFIVVVVAIIVAVAWYATD